MMRWSFWLFVLAEFCRCRRCETKGTWRGVCSGVPSGVQGQSSWGRGQGEPHEAVGFLVLVWPKEKANALSGCYFINCPRAVRLRKVVRVLFCCLRTGHEWINGHERSLDVERRVRGKVDDVMCKYNRLDMKISFWSVTHTNGLQL